jgi:hypothetical protein
MLLLTYVSKIRFPAPHAAMASPPYAAYLPEEAKPKWLDSGGYIALRRGSAPPPPRKLCRLCEEVGAEVCFAPDVPPPPDADVIAYLGVELRNAATALSAPCPLAPVVHIHPSPAFSTALKLALRVEKALGAPLVGVGGAVPHLTAHRYALVRSRAIEALNAAGRVHLFGAGSPTTLTRLSLPPGVSTDWAGWSLKASYGKVILPPEIGGGGGERHVTGKKLHKKYPVLSRQEAEALLRWLEMRGFKTPPLGEFIEMLKKSYIYRAQVNGIIALLWHQERYKVYVNPYVSRTLTHSPL